MCLEHILWPQGLQCGLRGLVPVLLSKVRIYTGCNSLIVNVASNRHTFRRNRATKTLPKDQGITHHKNLLQHELAPSRGSEMVDLQEDIPETGAAAVGDDVY